MKTLQRYQYFINQKIKDRNCDSAPKELYEPIIYTPFLSGAHPASIVSDKNPYFSKPYIQSTPTIISPRILSQFHPNT